MRAVRFVKRGVVVGVFLLFHVLAWLLGWLFLLVTFAGKERRQRWFGDRIRALFVDLGATFVKVGQIMSTRPDLFPPHVISALVKLQDDVGAFRFHHVERAFEGEFGKRPDEIFSEFDREPIASASVAQVHRAVLAGDGDDPGREVAVKVRRPNLDQIVGFDLTVMRLFARVISIVPAIRLFAPVESVDEFGRAIRAQIDLSVEADNNRRFATNFGSSADIRFPALIEEYCSERILTMEFVHGAKVLDYADVGAEPQRLARIGFHTLLKMIFEDGFVHADLHPGNILVTEDHDVVLIDLGLTAELDEHYRGMFAHYFAAWAQGDGKVMAKLMVEGSPHARVADYDAYEADIAAFVAKYYGKLLGEVQVSTVAFDMMNILRRHRVRVNAVFTMCNIAIAVTEGIGKQLAPDLDLMSETLPFFARMKAEGTL